ncbi:MAG: tetratricopeptide repeat protein [Elusimicrobia bacterium]|jgi:tetratricopeptide (TPR) repeat protein|nr:tetratricopeptide repeat protein [Elusimicrobiota bacterium]MBK7208171.1 tetratricopeptide repeat protein [Elusimicrobiota bacterium]MBK7544935.1 tetratricopeptide repeat protein [Elusimicrobiota bacterium]MBK7574451.1 tetratricopeptide repeat protein [Elusimicrobiota bacterium]MBK7688183.1 tetratricopeptide repeat protein [Elusimicrobiota bacterium]
MVTALSLLAKAERLFAREAWAPALALLRRRVDPADPFLSAEILFKKAECERALGFYKEALTHHLQARSLYGRLRVPTEEQRATVGASRCLRVLSRYREANRLWGDLPTSKNIGGDVPLERALVFRGLGRFPDARRALAQARAAFARGGDAAGLQHAYWALGGLERFSGRLQRALPAFAAAARWARRNGDESSRAFALCGLAGVERVLGLDGASLDHYREASRIFEKLKDPFGRAYGLCGRANALRTFGDPRPTLDLYRRSAALYRRLGDASSEGFARWGLGGSLRRLRRFKGSARAYETALTLFRKSDDPRGAVMALLGRARLSEDTGHAVRAARDRAAALAAARRHGLPYEAALARREAGARRALSPFGVPDGALRRWQDIP